MSISTAVKAALNNLYKYIPALAPDQTGHVPVQLGDIISELQNSTTRIVARIGSTANRALTGLAAIDGVTPVEGDIVLLKDQTDPKENGVYVASGSTWSRMKDASGTDVVTKVGLHVVVAEGTANADTEWILTNNAPIAVGTDNLTFSLVVTSGVSAVTLASTANGQGASLVGIEDAAALITGATVEAALAELVQYQPVALADPGDAAAIPVTRSANIAITTGGAGETNTLAIPTFKGQRLVIAMDVDGGGNRVVTAAQAINQAGNTIMTFADARDTIVLEAIQVGGALRWQVTANDGVALS